MKIAARILAFLIVLALCWLADRRAAKYTLSHKSMVEAAVLVAALQDKDFDTVWREKVLEKDGYEIVRF